MKNHSGHGLSPRQRYTADLGREGFHADSAQQDAVEHLQLVYETLLEPVPVPSLWNRLLGRTARPVSGLYLWGAPGRGKTYLMDCFFDSIPFAAKRRVHFHRFMLEIHAALDDLPKTPDPLVMVADDLARRYRVLCLDEFHITDIADAMLLGGLLDAMFKRNMVLVATSNTEPDALYADGIQRERFLPAIDMLKAHCAVYWMQGRQDFRLELLQHGGTYRVIDGASARCWLQAYLAELTAVEPRFDVSISLSGRDLVVRALADDVIWCDFDALCLMPRSARDYLELAREFHTLLLQDVPRFEEDNDEAARRFMHLIDALYDHGVKLVMAAAAAPDSLYGGTRLERAFRRTASRLTEMSSTTYLARPHRPD